MPRGQNLHKVRGTKAQLAARFGVTPLNPGEVGKLVWVRTSPTVLKAFEALTPEERGRLIECALRNRP